MGDLPTVGEASAGPGFAGDGPEHRPEGGEKDGGEDRADQRNRQADADSDDSADERSEDRQGGRARLPPAFAACRAPARSSTTSPRAARISRIATVRQPISAGHLLGQTRT